MTFEEQTGRISSFETLGTLDGPGVRFVVFVQGCPLKCGCCHNPETQSITGGSVYTAGEVLSRALKYREYFGEKGGITLSGGEPLLQTDFCIALFSLCKEHGITACLDTSGCINNAETEKVALLADTVLLDIKYTNDEQYKKYVGCSIEKPLKFLDMLERNHKDTWLRQVTVKGLNDNENNIKRLRKIADEHSCVKRTELLAFRKFCAAKYERLGREFPFSDIPETSNAELEYFNSLLAQEKER